MDRGEEMDLVRENWFFLLATIAFIFLMAAPLTGDEAAVALPMMAFVASTALGFIVKAWTWRKTGKQD